MQISYRTLIKHRETGMFLDKLAKGLTDKHSNSVSFKDKHEALDFMLNNRYAPVNRDSFELVKIQITSELMEDKNNV